MYTNIYIKKSAYKSAWGGPVTYRNKKIGHAQVCMLTKEKEQVDDEHSISKINIYKKYLSPQLS